MTTQSTTLQPPQPQTDEMVKKMIFELVQCRKCNTHIHTSILTCEDGHTFCSDCTENNTECNSCRVPVTFTRNLVMERLRDKVGCDCATEAEEESSTPAVPAANIVINETT